MQPAGTKPAGFGFLFVCLAVCCRLSGFAREQSPSPFRGFGCPGQGRWRQLASSVGIAIKGLCPALAESVTDCLPQQGGRSRQQRVCFPRYSVYRPPSEPKLCLFLWLGLTISYPLFPVNNGALKAGYGINPPIFSDFPRFDRLFKRGCACEKFFPAQPWGKNRPLI